MRKIYTMALLLLCLRATAQKLKITRKPNVRIDSFIVYLPSKDTVYQPLAQQWYCHDCPYRYIQKYEGRFLVSHDGLLYQKIDSAYIKHYGLDKL